ncbi:MAG: 3-dehydroquinate synthase [Candidatus Hydrogenedentes bacterium]|nr:3-dehydroquinate synthase [Candidatus Hydrogenedentota bacterium]
MSKETLSVELGERAYPIHIGRDILDHLPEMLRETGVRGKLGIVTDSNVGPLYADRVVALLSSEGFSVVVHTLAAGEPNKRMAAVEDICGTFLAEGLDRTSLVLALGGGVVGDVAGYAAASFMRGIPFLQIPTTIVAQVDSSVGGKTGVNHPLGKNTIGAFHQPLGVLIDMTLLQTLPERELRAGLAEAIKHGIIADAELFAYMEANAEAILAKSQEALAVPIRRSCEIKAAVVAEDEKEHGVRANLNYGHTFGHAIESVTNYETFLHGEAIALGMVAAGALSRELGLVDDEFYARQRAVFDSYGLPVTWVDLPVDAVIKAMQKDKKARAGTLKFIVADRIGHVIHRTDITEAQVRVALSAISG